MIPASALVLTLFLGWAVYVVVTVRALRTELESNIGWLTSVSAAQSASSQLAANPTPATRERARVTAARARSALPQIKSAARVSRDGAASHIAAPIEEGERALSALLDTLSHDGDDAGPRSAAVAAWCGRFAPLLRERTAALSEKLGVHWTNLQILVGAAMLLSAAVLVLLSATQRQTLRLRAKSAELVRAQAQVAESEKLSALGRMLAQLSHELNNPLNVVQNNLAPLREYTRDVRLAATALSAELAERGGEPVAKEISARYELALIDADLPEVLRSLDTAVGRMSAIFSEVRGSLRGERPERSVERLDLLVRATLDMVRGTLPPAVTLLDDLSELPAVSLYPTQVGQVVHNLVKNAVEAVGAQGTVRVATRALDDAVELSVEDDGPGVPPAHRARIFEPFFSTKDAARGSGLGLSVCHRIVVEWHQGTLVLEPTPRGARFVVRLPTGSRAPSAGTANRGVLDEKDHSPS